METKTVELLKNIIKILKPPEKLSIGEWADKYRYLSPEASAEPGKWKTDTTPYLWEIFRAIDDPNVKQVTLKFSAQMAKTEVELNCLGKWIHQDPSPILFVQPTDEMAKSFSKERVDPMIRDTPVLREIFKDSNKRNSGNNISHKMFPGGYVAFVGSNSPSKLASRPVRRVLFDEIDRFPLSTGDEGDPIALAKNRTKTFYNSQVVMVSTPTTEINSKIHKSYLSSTMEEWHTPCPSCEELQPLEWERIVWKEEEGSSVGMGCKFCGAIHSELEWKSNKDKRVFIAQEPKRKSHRGFHVNELWSIWKTWEQMRDDYVEAQNDIEKMKSFVNTSLGEVWIENLEQELDWKRLVDRREEYEVEVPDGVLLLTAGIDVQDNRLELEIVGWGKDRESWGIMYKIIPYAPNNKKAWEILDSVLATKFKNKNGKEMSIYISCIDTGGHFTEEVYIYIEPRQKHKRIIGIKGQGGEYIPIINGFRKTKGKIKIDLLSIGVNALKDIIYYGLKLEETGKEYCHFPLDLSKGYGEDYFKSLTAEVKTMKNKKVEWTKIRERNEALDCRNYARAALEISGVDLNKLALIRQGKAVKKKKPVTAQQVSKGVE